MQFKIFLYFSLIGQITVSGYRDYNTNDLAQTLNMESTMVQVTEDISNQLKEKYCIHNLMLWFYTFTLMQMRSG